MGLLIQIYVTLSPLIFKFVAAYQDGKSHVLFIFSFSVIIIVYILRSLGYCLLSCFNLNFLMENKKQKNFVMITTFVCCEADNYVLQWLKDRGS